MYFVFHYRTLDRERARAIQQRKREEQSGKSLTVCLLFEKEYSGTPPYDHPVYKTTSLLRSYSFKPNVKTIESFYYFEDPVNATTSLLRPGFYGPTVVVLTGFHCIPVNIVRRDQNKYLYVWFFASSKYCRHLKCYSFDQELRCVTTLISRLSFLQLRLFKRAVTEQTLTQSRRQASFTI